MKYNHENKREINECTSRAVCSIAPNIAALQKLIILFLTKASYYILSLEKNGGINNKIKNLIIDDFANLVSINEIEDKQLYEMLLEAYYLLDNVKQVYVQYYQKNGKPYLELDLPFEFSAITPISKAIALGEKFLNENSNTQKHKYLTDIMVALIKSICTNLRILKLFGGKDEISYLLVIKSLSLLNGSCKYLKILEQLKKLADRDYELKIEISSLLYDKFGTISKVSVSNSTKHGKAILVSGDNLQSLQRVLELTKDKQIDVYTHSNQIIAHALAKFKEYKNLIGHFGHGDNSSIYDFATFPGSVLISGGVKNTSEYLYRGKIYSDDYITHKGVIKLSDNDYTPLVEASLNAKGFSKGQNKKETIIGFDMGKIKSDFELIGQKLKNNEIQHLYIAISKYYSEYQREYFNEFFSLLKSNEYAVSFLYNLTKKNVLSVNLGNFAPLIADVIDNLFNYVEPSEKVVFIYTACDVSSISSIIKLKKCGINNIYMSDCSPNILNPAVFERFRNEYKIRITSTPKEDLYHVRKK